LPQHKKLGRLMTYQQTIDYLYQQLPMFSRIGAAAYKKDLHNTIALCEAVDNPHTKFKSTHIAGTNGKGSTSHMLAAILQQAGYKTALYTSPHLKDFRERIKINGAMVPEQFVIDFVAKTKDIAIAIQPSFFELTVVMAFSWFAEQKVDIAVIETGLGGRLDSTNVITPLLSVITNIGYDHMNILGNTLEEIAFEKAGIIKPNVPVVIGDYTAATLPVFTTKAALCNAPVFLAPDEYKVHNINYTITSLDCAVTNTTHKITEQFSLDLNGLYQTKNLCTVLCAEGILHKLGFSIAADAEKKALANVKKITGLHGRWDAISINPAVILDVAHNEDGIKQVLAHLHAIQQPLNKIHFIIGMVKDKEIEKVLALLPAQSHYYFTNAQIPRALPAKELQQKAALHNLQGFCYTDVNEAIKTAKENATDNDMIIVCGSVFLVGEVTFS
jgi:dihydrofolate synthase / folylpolyglutamate synthase